MMKHFGKWMITYCLFPIMKDLNTGRIEFIHPKLGLKVFKGTPCVTQWLYDWILDLGYIHIWRKSDYALAKTEASHP